MRLPRWDIVHPILPDQHLWRYRKQKFSGSRIRRPPRGLAGPEGVEAPGQVGVEPPLDGAWGDAQVVGDVLMLTAPVGQADDLEAVPVLAVVGQA